jgi:hypothetical protein
MRRPCAEQGPLPPLPATCRVCGAGLAVAVPLARIQQATGLCVTAYSRIRSGSLKPHLRHWAALAGLAEAKP